jgi:hypothetical protein
MSEAEPSVGVFTIKPVRDGRAHAALVFDEDRADCASAGR